MTGQMGRLMREKVYRVQGERLLNACLCFSFPIPVLQTVPPVNVTLHSEAIGTPQGPTSMITMCKSRSQWVSYLSVISHNLCLTASVLGLQPPQAPSNKLRTPASKVSQPRGGGRACHLKKVPLNPYLLIVVGLDAYLGLRLHLRLLHPTLLTMT